MKTLNIKRKIIIPRAKISLKYKDIFLFLTRLFIPISQENKKKIIRNFEDKFSLDYKMPRGVVFNKARLAFYFLLKNLNLKPGGEVLISALHVADFINIIRCAGFKPVVIDIDRETYNIDFDDLEKKITEDASLIYITHISGLATDMDKVVDIATRKNVPFIEDCSQSFSSYWKGQRLGTFGEATIFSLSLLKPVSTFFGGMVISKNEELINKLREEEKKLANQPRLPLILETIKHLVFKTATNKFIFSLLVFPLLNLFSKPMDFFSRYQRANKTVTLRDKLPQSFFVKFTWPQALLGIEQLKTVHKKEAEKISNAIYVYDNLKDSKKIKKAKLLENGKNSFWSFPINTSDIIDFKKFLARYGVDSTCYLLSVLGDEPEFARLGFKCPQASEVKKHVLLIPMYSSLTRKELEYITKTINHYNLC